MRAIEYARTGPASEVLTLVERDAREPQEGELRIRIVVSGVNPTDWKARAGSGDGAALHEPQVPGQDGAGVVDAVGPATPGFAPGDRVWVWDAAHRRSDGTSQEFAIVPAAQAVLLPEDVSFDVGASVGIPALTAHRALTAREGGPSRLAPGTLTGTTVLVTGGAGAVGHAAIQLAAWAGAFVITTVSGEEKGDLARKAGAHYVIDYTSEDVAAQVTEISPNGAEIVVEVNAVAGLSASIKAVARRGTISIYAGAGDETLPIPVREAMQKNVRLQFIMTYTTSDEQKRDAVEAVAAAIADGALPVGEDAGLPVTRFALADAVKAHEAVENNIVGKVLIDVTPLY